MNKRFLAALPLTFFVALNACVPAPKPTPAPTPAPAPAPTPTPRPVPTYSNWMDAPQTPGDWFYIPQTNGSTASFGQSKDTAVFSLMCDSAERRVSLARKYDGAVTDLRMTVRTETQTRSADANGNIQGTWMFVSLPAADSFLDAIAFSKGRFAVEVSGEPTLYLPSWPEITRVIEDCR